MTLTWVICGAGRRVGKTHLAQKLCQALPDTIYAKQGCSTKKPTKPENFFRTDAELTAFVDSARQTCTHIVVESNELARQGLWRHHYLCRRYSGGDRLSRRCGFTQIPVTSTNQSKCFS